MIHRPRRLFIIAAIIALLLYGALLLRSAYYSISGADAAGYALTARSILAGRTAEHPIGLDELELTDDFTRIFAPLGLEPGPRPRSLAPIYPAGVPLHMAAAALIIGWERGPFLLSPLAALLSLILIYLVARELGLGRGFAIAGATILAANPTFFLFALQPMSDEIATCWSLVAIWAALVSRRREPSSLLSGAAFGLAFLVRPTSALLLIPLSLSLRLTKRALLLFLLGGLPFAAVFFAYNALFYGHPLATGYTAIGLESLITLYGFTARLRHYLYWLGVTMSPLPLIGYAGFAFARRVKLRDRAMLISWFAVFLLFYSCYAFYDEWWYTRFLLPGLPALILGALLATREVVKLCERRGVARALRGAVVALLLIVVIAFERQSIEHFRLLRVGGIESRHADSCRWADGVLPDRALIAAMEMSGALRFYTNRPIMRYERIEAGEREMLRARAAEKGYGWYALLMPHEIEQAQSRLPGKWTRLGMVREISLWQIEPQ